MNRINDQFITGSNLVDRNEEWKNIQEHIIKKQESNITFQ